MRRSGLYVAACRLWARRSSLRPDPSAQSAATPLAAAPRAPCLQVEAHPYWRNQALLDYCRRQGVHVTAYSPLGSPDSASIMKRRHTPLLLQDPLVAALAAKYGKDAGQAGHPPAAGTTCDAGPGKKLPGHAMASYRASYWGYYHA
jgi:hypothetical protein